MMIRLAIFCAVIWAALAGPSSAHQASLAVLSVTELQSGRYALQWENRPTRSEGSDFLDYEPIWPEGCTADETFLTCGGGGLAGRVGFEGLGVAQSAAMIKIRPLSGTAQVIMLTPSSPTALIQARFDASSWEGKRQVLRAYVSLGVEHILIGVDHLIFVLGLMWIARTRWRLVKTITAFTVAHSVTLGAVSFGWIGVPEAFVNAMIALSIVFVGVEIMRRERGGDSATLRHPEIVAFGFGLLHGFGFANALMELGLPEGAVLLSLAAFNIGVELGQLAFVLLVLALAWAWREMTAPLPRRTAPPVAYAIGGIAAFWFVERVTLMMGA